MFKVLLKMSANAGKQLMFLITVMSAVVLMQKAVAADSDLFMEELVDPTAPLSGSRVAPTQNLASMFSLISSYRVSSILVRPNTKVAVINSRQVREGEMIGNAEVVRIEKDAVTLQVAGEERVLSLYNRSIKSINEGAQ